MSILVEHLLLGIIKTKTVRREPEKYGVTADKVLLQYAIRIKKFTDPTPEDKYQALKRYAKDLTDLAKKLTRSEGMKRFKE
jgi:ATP-dependent Clp protease ATP-binding subunit ClpB